jgi:uncharacterized protein YjiS (DUF1127 family)
MEMTMTYLGTRYMTARAPTAAFAIGPGLAGRIWKWIRRPVMIDRQRRDLNLLSDHILKDIGLSRADIDGIAMHLIDGRPDRTRRSHAR